MVDRARTRLNEWAALALTLAGLGLMFVLTHQVDNLWYRLALFYVFMLPAALLGVRLEWRKLLVFRAAHLLWGVIGASALYGIGWVGSLVLRPIFADDIERMYAVLADAPACQVWPLLVWIITCEEIVWRQAATQPFVARFGGWAAMIGAAAFALVHMPWAPPVLVLASFVFGGAWSWMAVRTRSFWAPFIAHIGWDILVMFVARY